LPTPPLPFTVGRTCCRRLYSLRSGLVDGDVVEEPVLGPAGEEPGAVAGGPQAAAVVRLVEVPGDRRALDRLEVAAGHDLLVVEGHLAEARVDEQGVALLPLDVGRVERQVGEVVVHVPGEAAVEVDPRAEIDPAHQEVLGGDGMGGKRGRRAVLEAVDAGAQVGELGLEAAGQHQVLDVLVGRLCHHVLAGAGLGDGIRDLPGLVGGEQALPDQGVDQRLVGGGRR